MDRLFTFEISQECFLQGGDANGRVFRKFWRKVNCKLAAGQAASQFWVRSIFTVPTLFPQTDLPEESRPVKRIVSVSLSQS